MPKYGGKHRPMTDSERAGIDSENRGRPMPHPGMVPAGRVRSVARSMRDRGRDIDEVVESQIKRR